MSDLRFNSSKFGHLAYNTTTEKDNHNEHHQNEHDDDDDNTHASQSTKQTMDHQHCLICYADDLSRHRAIVPCGHDDICATCHLRLRFLHNDRKCPVCKTTNETIIVDSDLSSEEAAIQLSGTDAELEGICHKKYNQYEMWGNELGAGYTYREDVGMHFPSLYHGEEIAPLFSLGCNIKNCGFTNESDTFITDGDGDEAKQEEDDNNNRRKKGKKKEVKRMSGLKALNEHLRKSHNLTLCHLCVGAKRDFISQLPRFTPGQLKYHQTKGEGKESGFKGHPVCEFCRPKRFYDLTKLHEHLNKNHYLCHVCEKQGKSNQFFKNYEKLSMHFDRDHFLCHDPQCLAARFVVFENEIDLHAHEVSMHGGSKSSGGSTKIQVEFRVRRQNFDGSGYERQEVPNDEDFQYGLDGEVFVPDALPTQENEPEISDPVHAARTAALRAQAAEMRAEAKQQEEKEAFPTLGGDSAGRTGIQVGWNSDGRAAIRRGGAGGGGMKKEDFPSLSTTNPTTKKNSIAARARAPRGGGGSATALTRQFASMAAPIPAASSSSASWASSAATPSGGAINRPASSRPLPSLNRQSDLAPENFPSLGGTNSGGGTGRGAAGNYAAAGALARKNRAQAQPRRQMAPSLTNSMDFPPPPTATSSKPKINAKKGPKAPSKEQLANMMNFPPPPSSQSAPVTVEAMKATLGPSKYKQLKRLTKDFAANDILPEAYVDQAAVLFDGGMSDNDFWSFVPQLISSCPNDKGSERAMRYMETIRAANGMPPLAAPPRASPDPAPQSTKKQSKPSAWKGGNTSAQKSKGQVNTKKSQKKKEKDELRTLAFGSR